MAIIDYSQAFSDAWSPLNTLMRGKLSIAERDMIRRERLADQQEQRNFLLGLERQRESRQEAKDLAAEKRGLAFITERSKEEERRANAIRAELRKEKEQDQQEAVDSYHGIQKRLAQIQARGVELLNKVGDAQLKSAVADMLLQGTGTKHLTEDELNGLKVFTGQKITRKDGTNVTPMSPDVIRESLAKTRHFTRSDPDERTRDFGTALNASLERVGGKSNPNLLELAGLERETKQLSDAASKLLTLPAVSRSLLAEPTETPVEAAASDPIQSFTPKGLPAGPKPVGDFPVAAPPKSVFAPLFTPSGERPVETESPVMKFIAKEWAARGSNVTPTNRMQGVNPMPELSMSKGFGYPAPPALSHPETAAASIPPEDIQGMRELAIQDGYDDQKIKAIVDAATSGEPSAMRLLREYHERYQAAKAQLSFGSGEPIPGIDDAYDFSGALR